MFLGIKYWEKDFGLFGIHLKEKRKKKPVNFAMYFFLKFKIIWFLYVLEDESIGGKSIIEIIYNIRLRIFILNYS
jgi:hypothetical protein